MPKLNDREIKEILLIENRKGTFTSIIDSAINELTYIRANERVWWGAIVNKYHLNKNRLHRIWIDGEILEERRIGHAKRKIF